VQASLVQRDAGRLGGAVEHAFRQGGRVL
jgi:hypothetical protein